MLSTILSTPLIGGAWVAVSVAPRLGLAIDVARQASVSSVRGCALRSNANARLNDTTARQVRIPDDVVNLADYELVAEHAVETNAWAYFAGGAGDEITVR